MHPKVKLAVAQGMFAGKEYVFTDRTTCTVGRADDCFLQMPNNPLHMNVSRYHCVFDIDPPVVKVRDLGSRNGTFVNGTSIGRRERRSDPDAKPSPRIPLRDGDEVRIGNTVFRIEIDECSGQKEAEPQEAVVVGS